MARGGHGDRLCSWMSLETWLGMFLYDILFGIGPHDDPDFERSSASKLFSKIIGPYAARKLEALRAPLAVAVYASSLEGVDSAGIESKIVDLMEILSGVWLLPSGLNESPTHEWLKTYLSRQEEHGMYSSWAMDDKVWSIFSFFSWDQKIAASHDARAAIDNLCVVAGLKTKREKAATNDLRVACGLEEIHLQVVQRSRKGMLSVSNRVEPDVGNAKEVLRMKAMESELKQAKERIKQLEEEVQCLQLMVELGS